MGIITYRWQIAYKKVSETTYKLIENPKWGWCADPFLVNYKGILYLFAEIFLYHTERNGVIGYCTFDGEKWSDWKITMDQHWHLSYPFVYSDNNKLYLCPESYQNGEVDIYCLESFPDKWLKTNVLFSNVKYADTTLFCADDKRYLFTFNMRHGGSVGDGLLYAITDNGPTDMQVISTNKSGARCGGKVLSIDGNLIRVAQDCENAYGEGLIFYSIDSIEPKYKEHEIRRIYPKDIEIQSSRKYVGLHTYNECDGVQVIDLRYKCLSPKELWGRHRVRKVFVNKYR